MPLVWAEPHPASTPVIAAAASARNRNVTARGRGAEVGAEGKGLILSLALSGPAGKAIVCGVRGPAQGAGDLQSPFHREPVQVGLHRGALWTGWRARTEKPAGSGRFAGFDAAGRGKWEKMCK